jgi:hypothetical protein
MTVDKKYRDSWLEIRKMEINDGRSEYRYSWREIRKTEINDGVSEI